MGLTDSYQFILFWSCFSYSTTFPLPYKFYSHLVYIYKKNLAEIFMVIILNMYISLVENWFLDYAESFDQKYGMCLFI